MQIHTNDLQTKKLQEFINKINNYIEKTQIPLKIEVINDMVYIINPAMYIKAVKQILETTVNYILLLLMIIIGSIIIIYFLIKVIIQIRPAIKRIIKRMSIILGSIYIVCYLIYKLIPFMYSNIFH